LLRPFWFALYIGKSPDYLFEVLHKYGKYGVQIFFVISGFVIPLSLDRGKSKISNYFRFLYKRILRLHPPYICAVILTLVIMVFSYKVWHQIFPENTIGIIKDFFYLHAPPDNPVFWTLAIEAQYYVFIGLFYFIIDKYPKIAAGLVIPILIIMAQFHFFQYNIPLFLFLNFFFIGNIGYLIYVKKGAFLINYFVLVALIGVSFFAYDLPATIASIITILIILLYKGKVFRVFKFFGKISYSLYLIHYPIGIKILNLSTRYVNPSYYFLLLIAVFLIVTIMSWIFCKLIEYPSEHYSREIKYKY